MLAELFAFRVILGKTPFHKVPRLLKPKVYMVLEEMGSEYLAVNEDGTPWVQSTD